jgi:YD repeat-containing protein
MGRERGDYQPPVTQGDGSSTATNAQEAAQRFGDQAIAMRQMQYMRQAADRQVAAPAADYKVTTNSDGTVLVKYNDGSSVKVDNLQSRRPLEFVDSQGNTTSIQYEKGSRTATGYQVKDGDGKVIEEGKKGDKDNEFKVKQFKDGKEVEAKDLHITDVKITPDGHLDFINRDGLHHERQRSGNYLVRDVNGRMLTEQTPGQRRTEYTYDGNNTQPSSFTVTDGKGNIVEHGAKGDKGWTVYKPGTGEASLDSKKLEDPAKVSKDPVDAVTDVQVNQRNGMRVEAHANGDRTWSTDKHEYRLNPSGSMEILDKLPDGKLRLVSYRDGQGVRTTYDYDDKGKPSGETREYPDGRKVTLTRDGDKDEWKTADGRSIKCKGELLSDGSVQMTYLDKKVVLTQCASGAELVKKIGADGSAKLIHVTDTLGREQQFTYADNGNGPLSKIELSRTVNQPGQPPFKQTVVWEKTGEENGQEVWETGNRKIKFVGKQQVLDDGSMMRTNGKTGGRTMISVRGVSYELLKEEAKPEDKK